MNLRLRRPDSAALWLLAICGSTLIASCTDSRAGDRGGNSTAAALASPAPADRELEPWRTELLDLAYASASAFPLMHHVKNRSRAQEAVVAACLELDQAQRALRYADGIADWRRGKCYADVAYHLAQKGRMERVQACLDVAQQVADGAARPAAGSPSDAVESRQEWRLDRVRAAIARTYVLLGQEERAARVAAGIADSEAGVVHGERARHSAPESFESEIGVLDGLVKTGSFDTLRAALNGYVELYGLHYGDGARRGLLEQRIPLSWAKLPLDVRVRAQMRLAESALSHADAPKALAVLSDARDTLQGVRWDAEFHLPLCAELAALRFRAGDREHAREDAAAARAAYARDRAGIVNIYRAGVLRPLAEAYVAMGDATTAREVYALAVEEGVENPNSRPRAEDLVATAASMAVHGFEPDAALRARLQEIRSKLGDPW